MGKEINTPCHLPTCGKKEINDWFSKLIDSLEELVFVLDGANRESDINWFGHFVDICIDKEIDSKLAAVLCTMNNEKNGIFENTSLELLEAYIKCSNRILSDDDVMMESYNKEVVNVVCAMGKLIAPAQKWLISFIKHGGNDKNTIGSNKFKFKFQMEKDLDPAGIVGKPITRFGREIGKITNYNYLNGYAGAEIYDRYHDEICREMGILQ